MTAQIGNNSGTIDADAFTRSAGNAKLARYGQLWQRVAEGKFGRAENFTFGWGFRVAKAGHFARVESDPESSLVVWESELLNYPSGADGLSGIIRAGTRVK